MWKAVTKILTLDFKLIVTLRSDDDKYNTPADIEELMTLVLMVQNSEPSNHDPEQVLLLQALKIQLDYIQANTITTPFCPHIFLMTSSMFKIDCSKPSPRCTLLSTHLHGS